MPERGYKGEGWSYFTVKQLIVAKSSEAVRGYNFLIDIKALVRKL